MYYVYVLKSSIDKKLYIGVTGDLKRRLSEHNLGKNISTKYRILFQLIYYEAYREKSDAILRERKLKQFKKTYTELKKRIDSSLRSDT